MADNVIDISFGVKGGGRIGGESGNRIKQQLESIAKQISLKINVNQAHFKGEVATLKAHLQKELGKIDINIRTREAKMGGAKGTTDAKKQAATYESVVRTLEKLYTTKIKVAKTSADTIDGVKAQRQANDLETSYKSQFEQLEKILGADDERIKKIRDVKAELEKVYATQKKQITTPKQATEVDLAKLGLKAQSLYTDNGFDKVIARSTEALKIVDDYNQKVRQAINNGISKPEKINELNAEFLNIQKRLKEIGRETDTVGNKIVDAFGSRIIQRVAQIAVIKIAEALRQVYQNVLNIDKAVTQLKIVTQATTKQIESAASSLAKSAREIGASVADLIDSTTVYARLGYNLADAQVLAEKTTMYAKVAGVNVDEATTNITGLIKAFNIGADGLEDVLDQLIYVGNNFPISQAEIGEAINNAGSSLAANGNTLQEAIGIVTAANASLQNVSKSSTAVRTIAARISNSTAELEELGEDTGIYTTNVINAKMQEIGVAVSRANGELRSTYDVLNDLAKRWGDLTDEQKASVANMLAGTRQQNAFYSIMNNWQEAESVVARASEGVGSLMEAHEIYLDSIAGKTSQLRASLERFSTALLDSDIVKLLADFVKLIINLVTSIVGVFDGLIPKTVLISTVVIALFNKILPLLDILRIKLHLAKMEGISTGAAFKAMLASIRHSFAEFMGKNLPLIAIGTLIALMASLGEESRGLAEIIPGAVAIIAGAIYMGIKGVDAAMKSFMASNPIGWILLAVTAVVALAKGIADLIESYNPSFENLKEMAQESADAWKAAEEQLQSTKTRLEEISEEIDEINSKDDITLVDQEQLSLLEEERANLEAIAAAQAKQAEEAKAKAAADAVAAADAWKKKHTVKDAHWLEWLISVPMFFMPANPLSLLAPVHQGIAWGSDTQQGILDEALNHYSEATEEERAMIASYMQEIEKLTSDFGFGVSDEMDALLREKFSVLDRYNIQTGKADVAWNRILADSRFSEEIERLKVLANEHNVSMNTIAQSAPQFLQYLKDIGFYIDGDTESSNALVNSIKNLRDKLAPLKEIPIADNIEAITDKFDALSNALKDVAKQGALSLESLEKLAKDYPSLLNRYFESSSDGYLIKSNYRDKSHFDILRDMAAYSLMEYRNALIDANAIEERTRGTEDHETALKNVETAQKNLNTEAAKWASILRETKIEDETDRLEGLQSQLEEQLDVYKELIDIRKDLLATYKEELDYRKELEQKQKAVADLQTQLSLARLDQSAAGQARARELESQLQEAEDELDDYTLERAIQDITESLDNGYSEYERFIKEQVGEITNEIDNLAKSIKDLLKGIDNVDDIKRTHTIDEINNLYEAAIQHKADGMQVSEGSGIANFINSVENNDYGEADYLFSNAQNAINQDTELRVRSAYSQLSSKIGNGIAANDNLNAFMEATKAGNYNLAYKYMGDVNDALDEYGRQQEIAGAMVAIKGGKLKRNTGKKYYVEWNRKLYSLEKSGTQDDILNAAANINKYENQQVFGYKGKVYGYLGGHIQKLRNRNNRRKGGYSNLYEDLQKVYSFHTGGFVGDVSYLRSNEEFAKLLKGEFVATPAMMETFIKKTLPAIASYGDMNDLRIEIDNLLSVNGNVTKDALPDLQTILNQAVDRMQQVFKDSLSRSGYKKSIK